MQNLNNLGPSAVGCFLASCLVGKYKNTDPKIKKYVAILSRLIDKAKKDYLLARDAANDEADERNLAYNEIIKRGKGQFIYAWEIINNLENCVNSVVRIYKVLKHFPSYNLNKNKEIKDVRDSIEHIDERINKNSIGPISLDLSEDALTAEMVGRSKSIKLSLDDLANEIRILHKDILLIIKNTG